MSGGIIADVDNSGNDGGVDGLLGRLRGGEVRALARAISMVEDGAVGAQGLIAACKAAGSGGALRIGITGPPGAGKSTLVDRMVRSFRAQGKTVGVLGVDPSSPYTGGALLGDRIRMQGFADDEGVYFRSMATRGATGGLAAAACDACALMEGARREVILIETVGAGQDEIEIAALADVTVVVLVPGMGDEVQSLKAGMMEIADIFVVNKADCDGAARMEVEIRAMQALGSAGAEAPPPVVRTIATTGEGVGALIEQVRNLVGEGERKRSRRVARLSVGDGVGVSPKLDHIGIAVRSIAAARGFYASLGIAVSHEETVEHEQVKTAMLPLGETRLELLEATAADSTIGRFVAKRGEGLHHLAVRVCDVDAVFARLRVEGVRLASDCVRIGAGGHRYFFIHPQSAGGILMEIVGDSHAAREGGGA